MKRLARVTGMILGMIFTSLVFGASLSSAQTRLDPKAIEAACTAAAKAEPAVFRPGHTKMWCAVIDREGKLLAINATDTGGTPQNPLSSDAWRGSIEIAIAKAYTAVAFSSNDKALDSRTVGLVTRQDGLGSSNPADIGTDAGVAPLWGLSASNPYRSAFGFFQGSDDNLNGYHHGIITFAGGQPVYTKGRSGGCGGGVLIGAVGVSGDGVDQDDDVAKNTILNAPISLCLAP
jgi:uncharacterized protein GlcG (DUF336 family)